MDPVTVKNNSYNAEMVLRTLRQEARNEALEALAGVFLRQRAEALADTLASGMLKDAEAAAAPFSARVVEAEEALAKVEGAHAKQMASFWNKFKPGDPEPSRRSAEIEAARENLEATRQAAQGPETSLRLIRNLIEALRDAPSPDSEALAVLAAGLKGGAK